MPPVPIRCADGITISGVVEGPEDASLAILIAGAMGVPARYYGPFCDWAAAQGVGTLRFDWRGMPGSPAEGATLHTWGEQDYPAAIAALRAAFPAARPTVLAHSVGGQLFGLLRDPPIEAALFVASQSGYWKNWPGLGKLAMWAFWHLGVPVSVALAGRLPMSSFGQGEDIPAGAAREWARWGRHPDYILSYPDIPADAAFHRFRGRMTLWAVEDDAYAPPPTVAALARMYPAAVVEAVRPADLGVPAIGHFGPFRLSMRERLWPRMLERLR